MDKTMEQLMAEKDKVEKQLEQEKHKGQRLDNRMKYLIDGDRRSRNHRLITRGAAVESIAPEVKPLSEREYYEIMEHILLLPEAKTALTFATVNHEKAVQPEAE